MRTMLVAAGVALVVATSGCSFMIQPKRSLDPRARQPSSTPVVIDGLVAVGMGAYGITELTRSCSDSQSLCWNGIDHAVGGVALALAAAFAISAVYGHERNADIHATPTSQVDDLAVHVSIAAHAGDCATAATGAAKLHATDRAAWEGLLSDEVVQACLLRASDDERRAVLDAIAQSPDAVPLAGSR